MADIKVSINTKEFRKQMDGLKNQLPFATAVTLTNMAKKSQVETETQINRRLNNPTRFAKRMMVIAPAKKNNLVSSVFVKEKQKQDKIFEHLFKSGGGQRKGKAFEGALLGLGVLPAGKFMVPGDAAPKNTFGNVRKAFIRKLIEFFSSFRPRGKLESSLPPGIWLRKFDRIQKKKRKQQGLSGSFEFFVVKKQLKNTGAKRIRKGRKGPKPEAVFLFVDDVRYKQTFDLVKTVNSVLEKELDAEFKKQFEQAVATARKL